MSNDRPLSTPELRLTLLKFVRGRVQDFHTAEDLTQTILLRAISKASTLRNHERLEAWLFRIARNVITDHYRRRPTTVPLPVEVGESDSTDGGQFDEEDALLRERLAAYVRGVVEKLPVIYRDALRFTDYEGHTQAQLAHAEQISLSAAKSRVQRARAEVQREIEACCHVETDTYGSIVSMTRRQEDPTGSREP